MKRHLQGIVLALRFWLASQQKCSISKQFWILEVQTQRDHGQEENGFA